MAESVSIAGDQLDQLDNNWHTERVTPLGIIVTLVWGILMAALVGYLSSRVVTAYLAHFPFFSDADGYMLYNIRLWQQVQTEGRWPVLVSELIHNIRHPLRTIPLVLFWPDFLAHPLAHMVTAIPYLAVFLFVLGLSLMRLTGSYLYSMAVVGIFAALPGLYQPVMGYAAYWLDLHAAVLIGIALLSLLNSLGATNLRWMALFSIFASLAVLSRYVALGVIIPMFMPIVTAYILIRWKNEKNVRKSILKTIATVIIPPIIIAGFFVLSNLLTFLETPGYDAGKSAIDAVFYTLRILRAYVGNPMPIILLLIFLQYFTGDFFSFDLGDPGPILTHVDGCVASYLWCGTLWNHTTAYIVLCAHSGVRSVGLARILDGKKRSFASPHHQHGLHSSSSNLGILYAAI